MSGEITGKLEVKWLKLKSVTSLGLLRMLIKFVTKFLVGGHPEMVNLLGNEGII